MDRANKVKVRRSAPLVPSAARVFVQTLFRRRCYLGVIDMLLRKDDQEPHPARPWDITRASSFRVGMSQVVPHVLSSSPVKEVSEISTKRRSSRGSIQQGINTEAKTTW